MYRNRNHFSKSTTVDLDLQPGYCAFVHIAGSSLLASLGTGCVWVCAGALLRRRRARGVASGLLGVASTSLVVQRVRIERISPPLSLGTGMSVIVHVGQAGNQIGDELWRMLGAERKRQRRSNDLFSDEPDGSFTANCVMVDTESRGLGGLREQPWISHANIVTNPANTGCGNNYACGYALPDSPEPSGSLLATALDNVRKLVESLDVYDGAVVMHSLSGGTGSGVGGRLIEELREMFPMQFLASCPVAPFSHGEASLQHYNSVMSMASLQQHADAITLIQNQDVLKVLVDRRPRQRDATGSGGGGGGAMGGTATIAGLSAGTGSGGSAPSSTPMPGAPNAAVSIGDMNQYLAHCISSLLQPMKPNGAPRRSFCQGDMVASVCPDPSLKLLELRASPFQPNQSTNMTMTWRSLVENLLSTAPRYDADGRMIVTLSGQIIARGDADGSFIRDAAAIRTRLREVYTNPSWQPFPWDCVTCPDTALGAHNINNSLTVLANRTNHAAWLRGVCEKAQHMADVGAYMHWYEQYGFAREDIESCLESCRGIVGAYEQAVAPPQPNALVQQQQQQQQGSSSAISGLDRLASSVRR